jgi:hypothetical protein
MQFNPHCILMARENVSKVRIPRVPVNRPSKILQVVPSAIGRDDGTDGIVGKQMTDTAYAGARIKPAY